MPPPFERSVFINCPFDDDYKPILYPIAFCITELDFYPRLASENPDNAVGRLDRIIGLICGSQFAIHDLSRCRADAANDFARLNMPFELGIDHGCRLYGEGRLATKVILVLEEQQYDYRTALSDIAGWDIHSHNRNPLLAVRHVNSWLVRQADATRMGAAQIMNNYATFQGWYYERELALGADEDEISAYPIPRVIEAMREWVDADRPGLTD